MKNNTPMKHNPANNGDNTNKENETGMNDNDADSKAGNNNIAEDHRFIDEMIERCRKDLGALSEDDIKEKLALWKNEKTALYEFARERFKSETSHRVANFDAATPRGNTQLTRRPTQRKILIDFTTEMDMFCTPDKVPHVDVEVDGCRRTYQIESEDFKYWLRKRYFEKTDHAPNAEAFSIAIESIKARVEFSGKTRDVFVRVGGLAGKIYLDLANEKFEVVEVDVSGWRVVNNPPVRFRRPAGMLPLPTPIQGGDVNRLRKFLNLKTEHDFVLVVAWLLAVLRYCGPYPLLFIFGDFGSGKSKFSETLKSLVDPEYMLSSRSPRDGNDLFGLAQDRQLLVFDNLSKLSKDLSDAFCILHNREGGYIQQGKEQKFFKASRPVIMNSIEDLISEPDLADRGIFLGLERILDDKRRGDTELSESFKAELPEILGALLDGMVEGLRNINEINLPKLPRLADFALWASACESAYWKQGTVQSAIASNRASMVENIVESDSVANAVRLFIEDRNLWEGSASELLEELLKVTDDRKSFPKVSNNLSRRLSHAKTFLLELGIEVIWETQAGRKRITIRKVSDSDMPEDDTSVLPAGHDTNSGGLDSGEIHPAQQPDATDNRVSAGVSGDVPHANLPANENEPPEVQEEGVVMKVGKETLLIMRNFSNIHDNLHLKGNELKVRNVSGNILAFAGIPESFPEFGLYQAKKFLLGMKRLEFSNPDWNFTSDGQLDVLENGGNFHWNGGDLDDESVFLKISKGMSEIPAPEMEFYMDRECIGKLKNACKKIDIKKLSIIGDGMHVSVGVSLEVDAKKGGLRNFALVLHPSTSKKFHFSFDVEILDKLLPRTDYNIGINLDGEGMLSFRRVSKGKSNLIYYVDVESHPNDESANDIPASDADSISSLVGNGHGADTGGLDSKIHPAQQADTENNRALVNGSGDVFDENLPASEQEQEPTEVHEIVRMKVGKDTIKAFGSLVTISERLYMRGNQASTWDEKKKFLAVVETPEMFPEFCFPDLECFLKLRKLYENLNKDPDWVFLSDGTLRLEGEQTMGFPSVDVDKLPSSLDKLREMNWSIDFDLNQERIKTLKKVFQRRAFDNRIFVSGNGKELSISCNIFEKRRTYAGHYFKMPLGPTTQEFEVCFDVGYLNKIPLGNYKMSISTEGATRLKWINDKSDVGLIFYILHETDTPPGPKDWKYYVDDESTANSPLTSGNGERVANSVNVQPQAIYHGDNLPLLWEMEAETVDLIATDPPFNTDKTWVGKVGSFDDRFENMETYVEWMRERVIEMHRILKPTGSIYLHCDSRASHYLKVTMDDVFGQENFRNEIIWSYQKWSNNINNYQKNHDVILYYVKGKSFVYNQQRVSNIGEMDSYRKERGFYPDGDRIIVYDFEKLERSGFDTDGYKIIDRTKSPEGKPMENVWDDINFLHPGAKERVDYPTQKPVELYKRIIEASSNPGDVVLDPFCGSGTTLVAAEHLGRRWIGIDASEDACKVAQGRLMNLEEADLPAPEEQLHEESQSGNLQPVANCDIKDSENITPVRNVANGNEIRETIVGTTATDSKQRRLEAGDRPIEDKGCLGGISSTDETDKCVLPSGHSGACSENLQACNENEKRSVSLKVSQETMEVITNFAEIHDNLFLKGNDIKVCNKSKTIIAHAVVQESFPEFKFYRAKQLLTNVKVFSNPSWHFTDEGQLHILEGDGRVVWNSYDGFEDEEVFLNFSEGKPKIPAADTEFVLKQKELARLIKNDKGFYWLRIVADGECVSMGLARKEDENKSEWSDCVTVPHCSTSKFSIRCNKEILNNLFPADYRVGINFEREVLIFRQAEDGSANLLYYASAEMDTYDETIDEGIVTETIITRETSETGDEPTECLGGDSNEI